MEVSVPALGVEERIAARTIGRPRDRPYDGRLGALSANITETPATFGISVEVKTDDRRERLDDIE